jgi:ferrous iron transport protein A
VCDPVQAPGSGDLERRLLELGFIEGAYVELLHTGFLGRDPLAVRINQTQTVALRRREANAVLVNVIINEHR